MRQTLYEYTCPACGYQWDELIDERVEADCPACGEPHVRPISAEDEEEKA